MRVKSDLDLIISAKSITETFSAPHSLGKIIYREALTFLVGGKRLEILDPLGRISRTLMMEMTITTKELSALDQATI